MFLFLLSCSYSNLSETISKSYFVSILSNALPTSFYKNLTFIKFHTYYAIRNTEKYLKLLFLFPVNQLQIQIRNNRNTRNIIFTLYRYAGLLIHKKFSLLAADIFTGKKCITYISGLKCSYSN